MTEDGISTFTPTDVQKQFKMSRFKQRYFKLPKNEQYDHVGLYFVDLSNYKLPATRH